MRGDRRDPGLSRPMVLILGSGIALLVSLLFARSPLLALAVAASFAVVAGALHRPEIAVYAVLFLLYSNLPAVSVAFHGVPKPLAAAFPLLLLVPLGRDLVIRRAPIVLTPTLGLLILLLAVQAAGSAFARDPSRSIAFTATFALEGVLLYFLITNVVRTREALHGATWSLIAAGVFMSAAPLIQQATGTFSNTYGGLAQVEGLGFQTGQQAEEGGLEQRQPRLSGTIGEVNRYAQVMLVLLPLALFCCSAARGRIARVAGLGSVVLIALGFALAFSRGGAVGLACMLLAMLALRLIDVRKSLVIAGGLALALAAFPQYWARLETIGTSVKVLDEESGHGVPGGAVRRRFTSMMAAARVFLDHPVLGVGPGMFQVHSEEYGNQNPLRRIEGGRRAHSLYLEVAAENGAVGLGLFLAALAMTMHGLVVARRAWLGIDPGLADLCAAFLLGLVCYLGTALFLHLSYLRYFYLLMGLCGAATEVALRTSPAGSALARGPVPRPEGGV